MARFDVRVPIGTDDFPVRARLSARQRTEPLRLTREGHRNAVGIHVRGVAHPQAKNRSVPDEALLPIETLSGNSRSHSAGKLRSSTEVRVTSSIATRASVVGRVASISGPFFGRRSSRVMSEPFVPMAGGNHLTVRGNDRIRTEPRLHPT